MEKQYRPNITSPEQKNTLSSNLQERISHQEPHVHRPPTLLWFMKKIPGRKKKNNKKGGHLLSKNCDLQGDLQLFKPISLCFLDGPEAGIGILLGKNPKKWPEYWDFGLNLKTFVTLEPWQLPTMKTNNKNSQMNRTKGLVHKPMLKN